MSLFQRLFQRKPIEEEIDPAIALIEQELDDELARDSGVDDDLSYAPRNTADMLRGFAQRCSKVALVGSCRRGKAEPGDIDVLYIPKNAIQVIEFLERTADDEKQIIQSKPCWSCRINGKAVDFIESTNSAWGWDMIQFTGSREFNERVIRHVKRRGYEVTNNKAVIFRKDTYGGTVTVEMFGGWSEEKILTHLGLEAFLNPLKREEGKASEDARTVVAVTVSGDSVSRSVYYPGDKRTEFRY